MASTDLLPAGRAAGRSLALIGATVTVRRTRIARLTERSAARAAGRIARAVAVGAVDRLEEVPERVAFVFAWDASEARRLVQAEPDGARVMAVFAEAVADAGPLTRESFRAAATRVKQMTGVKGRALFHPIRVAMTGWDSGPELDLALPAIDRVAAALPDVPTCAERADRVGR